MRHRHLIIALLVCSVLLPGIPIPGLLKVRPEELIVLALLPIILPRLRLRLYPIDLCLALIVLLTVVSTAWGQWAGGVPPSARDLMEIVKQLRFWLFFRLAVYPWSDDDLRSFTRWLLPSLVVAALIGVIQTERSLGIGLALEKLYGQSGPQIGRGRVIGTMPSPNYFSLMMVSGLALIAGALRWYPRRWALMVMGVVFAVTILLTQSRTGILAIGVVLATALVVWLLQVRSASRRRWRKWFVASLLILILLGLPLGLWLSNEIRTVQSMLPVEQRIYSTQGTAHLLIYRLGKATEALDFRVERWRTNLSTFSESPLIGWGPGKSLYATITDNGYVLTLRRYGLIGLILHLLLFLQIVRIGPRVIRSHPPDSPKSAWGVTVLAFALACLAANFFLESFLELQLMSLFWLMVGIAYSALLFDREIHTSHTHASACGVS